MHLCGEDPATIARAIPPNHAAPELLKEITALRVGSTRGQSRLKSCLTVGLQEKKSHWSEQSTRPATGRVDFADLNAGTNDEGECAQQPQRGHRSPWPRRRRPPSPVSQGVSPSSRAEETSGTEAECIESKAKASVAPPNPVAERSSPLPPPQRRSRGVPSSSAVERVASVSRSRTPPPMRASRKRESLSAGTVRTQQGEVDQSAQNQMLALLSSLVSRVDVMVKSREDVSARVPAKVVARAETVPEFATQREPPPTQEKCDQKQDEVKAEPKPKKRAPKQSASHASMGKRRRHTRSTREACEWRRELKAQSWPQTHARRMTKPRRHSAHVCPSHRSCSFVFLLSVLFVYLLCNIILQPFSKQPFAHQ